MISRFLIAAALLTSSAYCAPPLTTIQDVLYKADGTRFNGTLLIRWSSFEASDTSAIAMQIITTQVVNGALRVQLVPTANRIPAATYTVTYNSTGKFQFQEVWSIPQSSTPLRVRDVRVSNSPAVSAMRSPTSGSHANLATTINESDVNGLVADLAARPVEGPGYTPGGVAIVNDTGELESASGDPGDCVHVDGSSGPCGTGSGGGGPVTTFIDGETLSGILDGSNAAFSISSVPSPSSSVAVFRNGLLQKAGQDYNLTGQTIQFVADATPQPGDTLLASYRVGGATPTTITTPQILCAGNGSSTVATAFGSLASCVIPAGLLAIGDRVEVRLDFEHQGTASAFTYALHWGASTVLQRDGVASDTRVAVKADAGLHSSGAQWSFQSWGSTLAFNAGVGSAPDDYSVGLTLDVQGKLASSGDSLILRSYSVVRLP
jgi:hypothetical protein